MSKSLTNTVGEYLAERLPLRLFVPLSLLLVLASLASGRQPGVMRLAMETILTLSLLFQFRLWDDLHDRVLDQQFHPRRVLARTQTPHVFRWVAGCSCLVNLSAAALLLSPAPALGILLPLNAFFLLWYRVPAGNRLLHAHVVLLKYPVFVLLLSGGPAAFSTVTGTAMVLVYLSFAVHELLHDSTLRAMNGGERLLKVEVTALGAAGLLFAVWVTSKP